MDDDYYPFTRVRGNDSTERATDALGEVGVALGSRDDVPALLEKHLDRSRVPLGDVLAERDPFPLAEVDLAQVGLDPWLQAEPGGQRGRRFVGTSQAGHIDGVDVFVDQSVGQLFRLGPSLGRELRIAVAVDARGRRLQTSRRTLPMPHDQEICRTFGQREPELPVDLLLVVSHDGRLASRVVWVDTQRHRPEGGSMTTTIPAQTATTGTDTDEIQIIQSPPTHEDAELIVQLNMMGAMTGAFRGFDLLRMFEKPPTLAQCLKRYPRGSAEQGQISAFLDLAETVGTFVRQGLLNEGLVNDMWAVGYGWTWMEKIAKGLRKEAGDARMYENSEWLAKRATPPVR